ncbi:hypothetical protein EAF00_003539 [Botryotinia globosa]|nr:hypothetical protein EAF00_003539 [Botryotinia globosa]
MHSADYWKYLNHDNRLQIIAGPSGKECLARRKLFNEQVEIFKDKIIVGQYEPEIQLFILDDHHQSIELLIEWINTRSLLCGEPHLRSTKPTENSEDCETGTHVILFYQLFVSTSKHQ